MRTEKKERAHFKYFLPLDKPTLAVNFKYTGGTLNCREYSLGVDIILCA